MDSGILPHRNRNLGGVAVTNTVPIDKFYDWLVQGPAPDCDRICAAALAQAEPTWAERIERVLLRRGEQAWCVLIGRYAALSEDVKVGLQANPAQLQAAIALAVKSGSHEERGNALLALEADLPLRLAYLLPAVLRDPSPENRLRAGRTLRKMASALLDRAAPDPQAGPQERRAHEQDREQFVEVLDEALRTFDLHFRVEVLEACLWFARQLGERLWGVLGSRRSRAGLVVSEHFYDWNSPRLAGFLLSALEQPGWTPTVANVLRTWKSAEQIAALLRETSYLESPQVRAALLLIHRPQWFSELDAELHALPAELRVHAPRWVRLAGYTSDQRILLLTGWARAGDPKLRRGAVYALADLEIPEAVAALRQATTGDSPVARFTRWCVHAHDSGLLRRSAGAAAEAAAQAAHADAPDRDFGLVWQACRRAEPASRGPLLELLREHARVWRHRLAASFRSPDPRDRALAVQVVGTVELAPLFRRDVEALRDDPVEAVRRLAQILLTATSSRKLLDDSAALSADGAGGPGAVPETIRGELQPLLSMLADGSAGGDLEVIARVRRLLQQAYGAETQAQTGETQATESRA